MIGVRPYTCVRLRGVKPTQLLVQGIICILDTLDVQPDVFLDSFLRLHGVTVEELLKAVGEYDAEKVKALVKNWFK
jgi:hypothetical protein